MGLAEKDYVIGVDAGTTDLRAVVFDKYGNVIAMSRVSYETLYPNIGWAEQDANDWSKAFIKALKSLIKDKGIPSNSIRAVGITHQRETFVPVDENGIPLRKAILWFDSRAVKEVEWLKNQFTLKELLEITGLPPTTGWSLPKILWIKENEKDVFEKTYKFLLVSDFLTFLSTGEFKTSWASACTTQLFDINKFNWTQKLLEICQIPIAKLPSTVPPGEILGYVTKKFAEESMIPEGTPVVACGGDQQCGGLGVGLVRTGITSLNLGTSVILETFIEKPIIDPQLRYWIRLACIPGKYIAENGIGGGAYTLKWFKENFGLLETEIAEKLGINPYDILMMEAKKAPAGAHGLFIVPYWLGAFSPYYDANASGVILGLKSAHRREHIIRAIIEGVAYEIRLNLDNLEDALNSRIDELRVYGGGARSALWCQIIADICNKKVKLTQTEENTALGAAILAASKIFYSNIFEAAEHMVHIKVEYNPTKENVVLYDKNYKKIYKAIYYSLKDIYKEISITT
ncbi:MAG: FGGY family carbohydrate kinase [Nitrososphaeria archaeon]